MTSQVTVPGIAGDPEEMDEWSECFDGLLAAGGDYTAVDRSRSAPSTTPQAPGGSR